jgi:SAM-dependent methyltransferase
MEELDRQVAYWNGVAREKSFTHPVDGEGLRRLAHEDADILDYGCGYGRTCADLASLGYRRITGVDVSEAMIARGHTQYPDLDLRVLTDPQLPFEPCTFDVCILFAVLTCIPSDEGQRMLVADLHRVLRPGGILYISDYPIQNDERNQARYREFQPIYGTFGVFRLADGGVVRHHDMAWIRELLAAFEPVSRRRLEVSTMNGNPARVFQIFARKERERPTTTMHATSSDHTRSVEMDNG